MSTTKVSLESRARLYKKMRPKVLERKKYKFDSIILWKDFFATKPENEQKIRDYLQHR